MVYWVGLDIGSLVVKMVVLDDDLRQVMGRSAKAGHSSMEVALSLLDEAPPGSRSVVVTGYGRITFASADLEISEITCHARGALHLFPDAGTVIDVGGQDCKAMHVGSDGKVLQFVMNDRCAAGTGRFLEVMANALGVAVEDLDNLSASAKEAVALSSTCAVFAESEVVGCLTAGRSSADIAAGLAEAIASRIAGLVRQIGIRTRVVMTGGVANNGIVVARLGQWLGAPISVPDSPEMVGALGAALLAMERKRK
jgi:predicted CoA-substrate-specific enzyme activase